MKKRPLDILVISDLHLGTFGCRARELSEYLRSVRPELLILNGDIIDIWQFRKSFFPKDHMRVVKRILKLAERIPVYYITGNHDEALRRYSPSRAGELRLVDKLELTLDGKRYWFFHGDIFDASMKNARWLAKLGGFGYDLLIRLNFMMNWLLVGLGRPRMSFSGKVKNSVKRAVKFIADFEHSAAEIAIANGHDFVVCGHIHQPQMRTIRNAQGKVQYMNSGDWIEHMSALEYANGEWSLYQHPEQASAPPAREAKRDTVYSWAGVLMPF